MAVVTISRQYGAGGWKIAELIAKRIDHKIYDMNVLNEIAKKAKVSVKSVQEVEKMAGNFFISLLSEMASGLSFVRHAPGIQTDFDEEKYRTFLKRTIREIAARGDAIIIGRGGQVILKDHPRTTRVYLVAKDEDRVKNLMEYYGYDQKKAESIATKGEQQRLVFLQSFGITDPEDAHHYHLSINTSLVKESRAADLICELITIREDCYARNKEASFGI